jgi:hypothetical protein
MEPTATTTDVLTSSLAPRFREMIGSSFGTKYGKLLVVDYQTEENKKGKPYKVYQTVFFDENKYTGEMLRELRKTKR